MKEKYARARLLAAALAGVVGFYLVWQLIANRGTDDPTVRDEPLAIYHSPAGMRFAKAHPDIPTNEELRRLIEQDGLQGEWIGVVTLFHHRSGKTSTVAMAITLGQHDAFFPLTIRYLKAIAGTPDEKHAGVPILVIPDDLEGTEPMGAMRELERRFARRGKDGR